MSEEKPVRVLVAKPGLDGHDVGAKVVCRALMEAGMEVIYTGLRKSPEEIAQAALDENPDVLGLSVLSGAHVPACRRVAQALKERGVEDLLWIVGGNIPRRDEEALKALGVDGVFPNGTPLDAVADFIRREVKR